MEKTEKTVTDAVAPVEKIYHPDSRWYVIHALTGQELKIKKFIENTVADKNLSEVICEVLVPMEDVIEMHAGKKRTVQRKYFPGYLLIRMVYNRDTESYIRGVPGITGFVTTGGVPTPVTQEEVDAIMHKTQKEKVTQKVEMPFAEGQPVRVVDGPFKDFTGIVSEVHRERGKVRVMVSIFGRLTPVDVDFMQLKHDKK